MEQNKLKLEDYCLTIEQAKELQELGVNMSDTSMIIIQDKQVVPRNILEIEEFEIGIYSLLKLIKYM